MFLRLDSPHFVPLRSPLIQMVFGENGASVQTVMIGGRVVFHEGKLLTLDETVLRREAEEAAAAWIVPTRKPTRRRRPSRDWSEHSARRRDALAMQCRESSILLAKDSRRLKNNLLLFAKIEFA